jgi:glutamate dehydrogenase (NAD(P)+)
MSSSLVIPRVWSFEDSITGVSGWVALDSVAHGLGFGGMRVSSSTSKDEVEELARSMTLKLSIHGSPVGGAKGGLCIEPSDPRLEGVLQRFAIAMAEPLSSVVTLGKDMGTTNATLDRLYQGLGLPQLHLIAGDGIPNKLRNLTGYRKHMTGLGVAWATSAFMGESVRGAKCVIQGFGAVGVGAAVRLNELGAEVVGLSDHRYGWSFSDAISTSDVELMASMGRVRPNRVENSAKRIPRDDLFTLPSDVLILAAKSNSVSAEQAKHISAKLVVEGSNFGLTKGARKVLARRGITVVPDIIASSSSASLVARQLKARNSVSHGEVWSDIETAIREATERYSSKASADGVSIRTALTSDLG